MNLPARAYISATIAASAIVWAAAVATAEGGPWSGCALFLALVVIASKLKVRLPGIVGTLSVNYVVILMSVTSLTLLQTLMVGVAGAAVQCVLFATVRPKLAQVLFNLAGTTLSCQAAYHAYHSPAIQSLSNGPLILFWCAATYFLTNTGSVALIIALTERKSLPRVWYDNFFWTSPQYLAGAGLAALIEFCHMNIGWQYSVLALPAVYVVYWSYRLYLGRLDEEKKHLAEVSELHMRTIEALALAIEAKDDTTHQHLRRVQVYAREIAKELGFDEAEQQALEAASLLHDIGKLAVPEYILSKPGRLTPEEFEKIKVHPIVGAEILECARFPYPVVPIVRSHHEKWDGSGYPDGLRGEAIPLGARILSAVDCLDALASDRQYRRAMPIDDAMAEIQRQAGKAYDPAVVGIMQRRYRDLEGLMAAAAARETKLSSKARVERGREPAAGFVREGNEPQDFISSIAAARQEFQKLHEVTRDLGTSLSMGDTMSLLASRLGGLIPHDALAIYGVVGGSLIAQHVSGRQAAAFSGLQIPMGEGLSGWVAENRAPLLNGNPAMEPFMPGTAAFRSALSVPLEGISGTVGVLTLYHEQADAFTKDHLRILQAISSKAGLTIENALEFRSVRQSADTDALTGLVNVHSLFRRLDEDVRSAAANHTHLSVLVLDLDGFKQVNDCHGHLKGNDVLKRTADMLKLIAGPADYVARMGGDEFAVVLKNRPPSDIPSIISHIQSTVEEIGETFCGDRLLSASIGSASMPRDGGDAEQLLGKADRRMYGVKQSHHAQPRRAMGLERVLPALQAEAGVTIH